jgi:hypothetical protein
MHRARHVFDLDMPGGAFTLSDEQKGEVGEYVRWLTDVFSNVPNELCGSVLVSLVVTVLISIAADPMAEVRIIAANLPAVVDAALEAKALYEGGA